jgi:hypothetical protein
MMIRKARPAVNVSVTLLTLGLVASGCYKYVPVEMEEPAPGSLLRASLTTEGEQAVISRFGPGVREVHGMMLEQQPSELALLVDAVYGRQGTLRVDAAAVRFRPEHVSALSERRLSVGRSALFGIGLAGVALLLVESLGLAGRQLEPGDDGPPGPQQIRIPLSLPSFGSARQQP